MTNAKQSFYEHLATRPETRRLLAAYVEERIGQLHRELEDCPDDEIPKVRGELRATRQLGTLLKKETPRGKKD